MRTSRPWSLAASALLVLAPALASCGGPSDSQSADGPVEVAEVGDAFTFQQLSVAEGWTLRPVERTAGMESVTSPEITGEVTNEGDEPAYALFEMVFARDGEPVSTVRCSSKEIGPGESIDVLCPGLGMPMPDGHDQIVVQEISR